jgi:tRNA U38,U39,U40 pseudouridine synthase TruA
VHRWEVTRQEDTVVIECEANGFLKQQIRKANGILTEIGKKKQPIDLVDRVLESKSGVWESIPLLPAHGLCLIEVKYPEPALPAEPENTGKADEKN